MAVCQAEGVPVDDLQRLRQIADTDPSKGGTSLEGLVRAAKAEGFTAAEAVQMDRSAIAELSGPAIAWVDGDHYLAVLRIRRTWIDTVTGTAAQEAIVRDPDHEREEVMPLDTLLSRSGGVFVALGRQSDRQTAER